MSIVINTDRWCPSGPLERSVLLCAAETTAYLENSRTKSQEHAQGSIKWLVARYICKHIVSLYKTENIMKTKPIRSVAVSVLTANITNQPQRKSQKKV